MTNAPILLATAQEMREMDRVTIVEHGVDGLDLMEAAGTATARGILDTFRAVDPVVILCGSGNNGGDGFVIARELAGHGRQAIVVLLSDADKISGDAKTNFDRLSETVRIERLDMESFSDKARLIREAGTIVDALLGTGIERDVEGLYAQAINAANETDVPRISVDMPSGLSTDTGQVLGTVFRAHHTYTYGLAKPGQFIQPGCEYSGKVHVIDIGIPSEVVLRVGTEAVCLNQAMARRRISLRDANTHKGSFGHVLLAAGSPGKLGAALLSSRAAIRSGVGLATCISDRYVCNALAAYCPETMTDTLPDGDPPFVAASLLAASEGKSAVAFGPGWGIKDENLLLLREVALKRLDIPILLDADALTLAASGGVGFLRERYGRDGITVLTPHPGEAARFFGKQAAEIQEDRAGYSRRLAAETGSWVVLKGYRTLISSPEGYLYLCPFGNPGMATGGTGDVLAGLLGGLLAQPIPIADALIAGVSMHSIAGDRASRRMGQHGLCASDVVDGLGEIWAAWEAGRDVDLDDF